MSEGGSAQSTGEPDEAAAWKAFRAVVNMSPAALERWLGTEESRSVGWTHEGEGEAVGHREGRRIVEIRRKRKRDLTPDDYRHNSGTGEDNAAAHLRSITVGHEVIVPVTDGRLDFGPWQRVFYGEWDGQRRKRVVINVLGERAV